MSDDYQTSTHTDISPAEQQHQPHPAADGKPGPLVSWIAPLIVVIALIGLLWYVLYG